MKGVDIKVKKRIIIRLLAASLLFCVICAFMTSCSGILKFGDGPEIAVIDNIGEGAEHILFEETAECVKQFASNKGKSYGVYTPMGRTIDEFADSMMSAIVKGAKLVVCPGGVFESAVFKLQDLFPDISFLLVDGIPNDGVFNDDPTDDVLNDNTGSNACENIKISSNVCCLNFKREEAGYVAGYLAVKNGYTKFGFISDTDSDADTLYGCGLLQGINAAATEFEIAERVEVNYKYCGKSNTSEEVIQTAEEWYSGNTEIIFASGATLDEVIVAAQKYNGRVIGSEYDCSYESTLVVCSAINNASSAVKFILSSIDTESLKWKDTHAGTNQRLGVTDEAVGLATSEGAWRLVNITPISYDEIISKIIGGSVKVSDSTDIFNKLKIKATFQS